MTSHDSCRDKTHIATGIHALITGIHVRDFISMYREYFITHTQLTVHLLSHACTRAAAKMLLCKNLSNGLSAKVIHGTPQSLYVTSICTVELMQTVHYACAGNLTTYLSNLF